MDFKIVKHNCSRYCLDVPFEGFIGVHQRSRSQGHDELSLDNLLVDSQLISFLCRFETVMMVYSTLPKNKILDWNQSKTFADSKLNIDKIILAAFDGVESIVEKVGNAGYQHFLLFPQYSQRSNSGLQ